MTQPTPPNKSDRIAALQAFLKSRHLNAALLFFSRDIFYYTGTAQPCILLVTPEDYQLLVRRAMDFALEEVFIPREKVHSGGAISELPQQLSRMGADNGRLGLLLDVLPAQMYCKLQALCNNFSLEDISEAILLQRAKKDEEEIKAIQDACRIMDHGHCRLLQTLQTGMREKEAAAEMEYGQRLAGHEGVLSMRAHDFYISRGPVASGENLYRISGFANTITGVGLSPAVPAGPSDRPLRQGDLLIVDIPTCCRGYHCDQTRTYSLGPPDKEISDLFQRLRTIADRTIAALRAGISCGDLFATALNAAKDLGVEEGFLGRPPRKANFIGHGIGLDANEPPVLFQNSSVTLLENYVLALELHLTHPTKGVVKLEDLLLVKKNQAELLTLTPRELFVLPGPPRAREHFNF